MNGTGLSKQINTIEEMEELEYTNIEEFCLNAFINRQRVFWYEYWSYHTPNLETDVKIFENKIKDEIFDEQTVQLAKEIFTLIKNYYARCLWDAKSKFDKSVREQIFKYRWTARALKVTQHCLQIILIVGAVSVPLILSNPTSPREISTVISIVVAASAALLSFYKFQDQINFQHTAAEKMQLEYGHYLTDRGIYEGLSPGQALDRLMDEIDKLRQETNELSLSLEQAMQDQQKDQILRVSKSIPEIHHIKETK